MKPLFLSLLGIGAVAAIVPVSAQAAPPFVSAIGDDTNVVFVENHVTIDRPAQDVYNFVTTPANIPKWFLAPGAQPRPSGEKPFITGALGHPNVVGDQVFENINFSDGRKLSLVQTTVVSIPGFQWTTMGQVIGADGKPGKVLSIAVWTVQPVPGGKSKFSRFFALVRSEGGATISRDKNGALDPVKSQEALERLKTYMEDPKNAE